VMCAAQGMQTVAAHVDHKIRHGGDQALFWDKPNWQPLCAGHHNSLKQREEKSGMVLGCDVKGNPNDPRHPWHR